MGVETRIAAFTDHLAVVLRIARDLARMQLLEDEYDIAARYKNSVALIDSPFSSRHYSPVVCTP